MRVFHSVLFLIAISIFLPLSTTAQDTGGGGTGGGGGGTGGAGGGNVPTATPDITAPTITPAQTTGQQTTSSFEAGQFDLGSTLEMFNIEPPQVEIENLRIQPFVGRSLENFQLQEMTHPRSQFAPGTAGSASTGGLSASDGRTGFGQGIGGRQGQLGGAQQNGFEVVRQGLRTRVRPQIVVNNRLSGVEQALAFRQRMTRLPSVNSTANNVSITINGGTALLTGTVANEMDRERIERMTRLEPNIFRIDNQITIAN